MAGWWCGGGGGLGMSFPIYLFLFFLHSVACIKTCTDGGANQVYRIADDQHER